MKKSLLSKIPVPAPIPTGGALCDAIRHYIATQEIEIEGVQGIALNFLHLQANALVCDFRSFFFPDNYITQQFGDVPGWKTGAITSMKKDHTCNTEFLSLADNARLCDYLKDYNSGDMDVWKLVSRYQHSIMDKRLEKKHEKEKADIDRKMSDLHELPDDFGDWVGKEALSAYQFVFYKRQKHGQVSCQCSVCGQEYTVPLSEYKPEHQKEGKCIKCGKKVTFIARGRQGRKSEYRRDCIFVDPTPDGYFIRFFNAYRVITKTGDVIDKPKDRYVEIVREHVAFDKNGNCRTTAYQYGKFRSTEEIRWSPEKKVTWDTSPYAVYMSVLYTGNLPEALVNAPARYSQIEHIARENPGVPLRYYSALTMEQKEAHAFEILMKSGFESLCREVMEPRRFSVDTDKINWAGNDLKRVLRMDTPKSPNRPNIQALREAGATLDRLAVMQAASRMGVALTKDMLIWYMKIFGKNTTYLSPEHRHCTLYKLCSYFEKLQAEWNRPYKDLTGCWKDYIGWCAYLGLNLNEGFRFMPPVKSFFKIHDDTYTQYVSQRSKKEAELKKIRDLKLKEQSALAQKAVDAVLRSLSAKAPEKCGLFIKVPENSDEIFQEGEKLVHCVRTRIPDVADGKTTILFVRKREDPDTPYYTLEFRDGKVAMCTGYRNKPMTDEVRMYVSAFEKQMQDYIMKELEKQKQMQDYIMKELEKPAS